MKNLKLYLFLFFIGIFMTANSQTITNNNLNDSGLRLAIRTGFDAPAFGNNTPYIDYNGGLEIGASVDYYWHWIGIGADFDYINNNPKSTYPTTNLILPPAFTSFSLQEGNITRMFYGVGPSFKFQKTNKSSWELKLRAGLSSIKGGRTELTGTPSPLPPILLNFHAGYNLKNAFAGKASLQYNYFFTKNIGFHIGAYYLQHFKGTELVDPTYGISAGYLPYVTTAGSNQINANGGLSARKVACDCEIHSIGAFAGLTFAFGGQKAEKPCPVCKKVHSPQCCTTCGCNITITARDKFTKELLADTDVVLADSKGNIVKTGTTNSYGVVVFTSVPTSTYIVKGKLHEVDLAQNSIATTEFENCQNNTSGIQKEILYTDENFIIKGKAVVCNTPTGIDGVLISLKNTSLAIQKSTNTNIKGEFIFHALQKSSYSIYGKKANYMSQTEVVSTQDYDRNKTLFIKLEICMDPADCGKAIVLKNILYDLDEYFIREDAKPELYRLIRFMIDNPDVKVELSSHTDSRGSNSYNQTLSQNRADAAVDYVVSQGISRNRLIGKGYGESKLLNRCADDINCSEIEHQKNRRTEVKVVCPQ